MTDAASLIEAGDLNGLLRLVDALCERKAWDELIDLAERCEEAVERGKQLWPIAAHIDYRLALEAPGDIAATVLESDLGRFAPGPLTEVIAFNHTWDEVADHIETPQSAAYVAQERVLRGQALTGDPRAHSEVLELPLHLERWEPTYALARYLSDHVEVAEPWEAKTALTPAEIGPAPIVDDDEVVHALLDLVAPWTTESNGAARAVMVEGDVAGAASHLVLDQLRVARIPAAEAIQRMAWAAASGGAHGKRRGAALGRSLAWFTATILTESRWPPEPEELHRGIEDLEWMIFDEGEPEKGWVLRVAVGDPGGGWAAAISATDLLEDDEQGT